jgi:hypothetical protein
MPSGAKVVLLTMEILWWVSMSLVVFISNNAFQDLRSLAPSGLARSLAPHEGLGLLILGQVILMLLAPYPQAATLSLFYH